MNNTTNTTNSINLNDDAINRRYILKYIMCGCDDDKVEEQERIEAIEENERLNDGNGGRDSWDINLVLSTLNLKKGGK